MVRFGLRMEVRSQEEECKPQYHREMNSKFVPTYVSTTTASWT